MLPATARQAIAAYTQPGDLVLDPMCGIGTTLVEAAHLGRHALGIEYEARWAQLARANLTLATSQGAPGTGQVHLPGPGPTGAPRAGSRDPCPLTCPPIWRAGVVGASPTPSRSSHKYRHPVSRDSRAGGRRRPERAPPPGPGPGG
jgi:modification methylase